MNDDENEDIESGLDVLKDTEEDILDEDVESPLGQAVEIAEPLVAQPRPFRSMLVKELEEASKRLMAKPEKPPSALDRLIERFNVPTGKSGDLFAARQQRDQERATADAERRKELMNILSKLEQAESQGITEQQRIEESKRRSALDERRVAVAEQRLMSEQNRNRLQGVARQIVELQSIVDDESNPKPVRDAAQRQIDSIGTRFSTEDRSTLGQMVQATKMANSSDPDQARIGKAFLARFGGKDPTLTVSQQREDLQIQAAIDFLKTIPPDDIDKALRSISISRTPYQERIIKAWELSQRPTYSSVLPTVGKQSGGIITATEDNLTDEEKAELKQLREDLGIKP